MELRSCYFCGRAGESLDSYPVVPERSAADATAADPVRVVLCPDCRRKLRRILETTFDDTRSPDDATTASGGDGGPEISFDAPENDADGPDDTDRDRASGAERDRDSDPADGGDGDGDGDAGRPADRDTIENGDRSADAGGVGSGSAGPYRKALRLLQNREFPVERTALVEVMKSAYDLDAEECERIVEFAVERGVLTDDDGTLRRV